MSVAFNIYPGHFLAPGFADEMSNAVAAAHVPPDQVVLEITERQELADLSEAADVISDLKERGFRVAMDDAGTGHSGLSYLQRLHAQVLKIDKIFVDGIQTDHSARVIIEMLVRAASDLGMVTVAEGIESSEQLAWLKTVGVDEGQGFLVSQPLATEDFLAFVRQRLDGPPVPASSSESAVAADAEIA